MKKRLEIIEYQWLAALTTLGESLLLKKTSNKKFNFVLRAPIVEKKQKKSKFF